MEKQKPNGARANNPTDPEIVRELIAIAHKERASIHSLVASLGEQISRAQELVKSLHHLTALLDDVLLQLEQHQPSRLAQSIRKAASF
jgi:hypothetical protein